MLRTASRSPVEGWPWRLIFRSRMESTTPFSVSVEHPDGTRLHVEAELRLHHVRRGGDTLIIYLPGIDTAYVPMGSKVWKV